MKIPEWTEHAAVAAAKKQSAGADGEMSKATRDLDRAQGELLAAERACDSAETDRQAQQAEAGRDSAAQGVAAARKEFERAQRSVRRAAKATADAKTAAKRETAGALRRTLDERIGTFAQSLVALRAVSDDIRAVAGAVERQFPHHSGAAGLVDSAVGVDFNNPPVLAPAGRLDALFGRRGEKIDHWLAIAESVGYRV